MTKNEVKKTFFEVPEVVKDALPFRIESGNETLAIITHGFTSSPYHLRHLAEYLAERGIDVETILLAGHGSSEQALEKTSHHDWLDSVESVLLKNLDKYKKIYMIGHSLGANISICLSVKYPQIKGIVSLGASIYLRGEFWQRFFLPWYKFFGIKKLKKMWLKPEEAELIIKRGGRTNIPIKSVDQLYKFIDTHTKKEIAQATAPILIVHSRYDKVSHPYSSQFLFENIASQDKELFILDKSDHGLLQSTRRDFLFKKIVNFIGNHN
ncbi:alpha/beta fold hydrolase [Patescibacteria group bacterium]|nr:alpha/beta fold hydrolase [Patescibacteria group bacterium]